MQHPPSKKLLICDLDNTLYDWVGYFVAAFYDMVDEVVNITGCDREKLLDDFRVVHRRHHDSEHPFSLLETSTIRTMYPNADISELAERMNSALHAFNSSRKNNLHLYAGVEKGLERLSAIGITLVAHTESKLFSAIDRLTRLNLTRHFQRIYCREASTSIHPNQGHLQKWQRDFPSEKVTELSHHQRKPNVEVVAEICRKEGFGVTDAAYVGDSISRDIMMAKDAGIYSIWAKYGTLHSKDDYAKLVRISHWSDEDVQRERSLVAQAKDIQPDAVLYEGFDEILNVLTASRSLRRA